MGHTLALVGTMSIGGISGKEKEMISKRLIAIMLALAVFVPSVSWGALPNRMRSARMTGATLGKDIPTYIGALESAVCDILGFTIDSNVTESPTNFDNSGRFTKSLLRQYAAAPVGWRFKDSAGGREYSIVNTGNGLAIGENTGTEGTPVWTYRYQILGGVGGAVSLDSVVAAAGSDNTEIIIGAGSYSIASDLIIPSNISLSFAKGAILSIATTKTLTVNGTIEAGLYQIFSCAGTGKVTLGTSAVKGAYPQWWGAVGDFNGVTGTNNMAAFKSAVGSGAKNVIVPDGDYYFTGDDSITIPQDVSVGGVSQYGTTISVGDCYSGETTKTHALFVLGEGCRVGNFNVTYTGQTLTDAEAAIIQYPPLFYANCDRFCLDNIYATKTYIFLHATTYAQANIKDILAYCLYRGVINDGAMGDTVRYNGVQLIMNGGSAWGSTVDLWCRSNSYGFYLDGTAGNIDSLFLTNVGVIGGYIGYYATGTVWTHGDNIIADVCTQPISWNGSYLFLRNLWSSAQNASYNKPGIPPIRLYAGEIKIDNSRVASAVIGGANLIYVGGTASLMLSNTSLQTSRGACTPALVNAGTGTVQISNCYESGTVEYGRVNWRSVIGSGIIIDGISAPSVGSDISPTNFNMDTWAADKPDTWDTSLAVGDRPTYIRDLEPITGDPGIEMYSTTLGTYSLYYIMPAAVDDLPGYFWLSFSLKLVDATFSNVTGTATFQVFYHYTADLTTHPAFLAGRISHTGISAEVSGIPRNEWVPVKMLICAPLYASRLKFLVTQPLSAGVKYQLKDIKFYTATLPRGLTGNEYFTNQTDGDTYRNGARDIFRNGSWRLGRVAMPTTGTWVLSDEALNMAPTVVGGAGSKYIVNGWRRITSGSNNVLNTDWVEMHTLTGQ